MSKVAQTLPVEYSYSSCKHVAFQGIVGLHVGWEPVAHHY
jgi:hypothetical protein